MTVVYETWLPVVEYEGLYEVSDQGRVRSLDRIDRLGRLWRGKILKICGLPYPHITLRHNGLHQIKYVHILVLEAFIGPCPPGREACHRNDIKNDNRLENLRWDTRSANFADAVTNGKRQFKTQCKNGHRYTRWNTLWYKQNGKLSRRCKLCHRKSNRKLYRRTKVGAA